MSKKYQPLPESIYHYLLNVSIKETEHQRQLREATDRLVEHSAMMTTPDEVQFFQLLIKLIGAKRAIEIGVFTGYGSLSIAQALPEDGELVACDNGEEWPAIGRPYWEKAGVSHKINLKIAPALETLQQLLKEDQAEQFDFIFIDADKIHYDDYYELSLKLLKSGGLLAIDNVLFVGKSAVCERQSPGSKVVDELNKKIHKDSRVEISMLPIAYGVTLIRKI